ncbi:MAG: CehA/McbA family metallohydrolase [Myxococcota bacterium]|nr:CehA/McbA family metallohydrolase [Myxococcota bacterium]
MQFVLVGLVAWIGCGDPPKPLGVWMPGDVHVHSSLGSNDTDGEGLPEVLGAAMERAGLEWLVLTDHSNSAGSMHCDDVEDCPNLGPEIVEAPWPDGVYMGSEISLIEDLAETLVPNGHIGCIAKNGYAFEGRETFQDRPAGSLEGADAVAQCHEAGGWAIINHPYSPAGWMAYDWSSETFEGIEVYNGGARFDAWDSQGLSAWEERVADGRDLVPVGGSDCHRWAVEAPGEGLLDPALGYPTTWVQVRDGESPVDALLAGRVVIAEPGTTLEFWAVSRTYSVGPGESTAGEVTLNVRSTVETEARVLELREVGGDVIERVSMAGGTGSISVSVGTGTYYARVWPEFLDPNLDEAGIALTAAIRVKP